MRLPNEALSDDIVICTSVYVGCVRDVEVKLIVLYHAYCYYYYY